MQSLGVRLLLLLQLFSIVYQTSFSSLLQKHDIIRLVVDTNFESKNIGGALSFKPMPSHLA